MKNNLPTQSGTKGSAGLIVVLAMLSAFAPFATDMYLPGFAQMATAYNTDHSRIEGTLSAFFLGLALGQAIYGPLIDRFGRRLPLLFGVALFALATLGCLLTRDIDVFTGLRVLQAMGGCAGMIVGRAVINDLYGPTESARALSLMLMLMTLAPIVAPLLGGWILIFAGWQAIFGFLLAFSAVCAALVWFRVPETLPVERRTRLHLPSIFQRYAALLRRPAFIMPALVGALANSSMFAYITGSPFIFMGRFGLTEQQYGLLFGSAALGIMIGAQANRIGLRRLPVKTMLGAALSLNLSAAAVLLAVAGTEHVAVFAPPLWFVIASLGFINGNAAAIAMSASGEHAGMGSALIGVLQFTCAFTVSSLVAASQNGTAYPMAIAMVTVSMLANVLWIVSSRLREKRCQTT